MWTPDMILGIILLGWPIVAIFIVIARTWNTWMAFAIFFIAIGVGLSMLGGIGLIVNALQPPPVQVSRGDFFIVEPVSPLPSRTVKHNGEIRI